MIKEYLGFDLEIASDILEGKDWREQAPLGITCASCVGNITTHTWWAGKDNLTYTPRMSKDEVCQIVKGLKYLSENYHIFTWNGLSFDFEVLARESGMWDECKELALSHYDIMFQFFCLRGFPIGLDTVAKTMGLPGKPEGMSGALAPQMWRDGKYNEVIQYVIQDSKTTYDVACKIQEKQGIMWTSKAGKFRSQFMPKFFTVKECFLDISLPDTSWMDNPMKRENFMGWLS